MNEATRNEGTAPDEGAGAGTHLFIVLCAGLVISFLVWAHLGKIDIVSSAMGEVVPSSQVKSVQNLEGGIVRQFLVREGDRVKGGQPLVILESTASGADVQELEVRIASHKVDIARLEAELANAPVPKFSDDLILGHLDLVQQAHEMFKTRRSRAKNELAGYRELANQRQQEIGEISARLANERERLKLLGEQISISEDLLKSYLTNRMLHLNLLKEASDLKGRIGEDGAALKRAEAAFSEAKVNIETFSDTVQEQVRKDLELKSRALEELSNRLEKFADSLQRRVLRSPVDGVVKTLYVYTVGGVVQPGATVVDVVPGTDRLVIEAKLSPQDIGYVHAGQTATVRLASSDAARFGNLDGEVVQVSPDTLETAEGIPYYKVRITTAHDYFEIKDERYRLVPGVQVMCNILTGQRSVLQYLSDPFLGSFQQAFSER
ncbi:MAG TPA: HlyD family type I secretion periplasmic adaptor subunit [Rhodospirillales bacterium]|jgi:adhesin transport system membrane fusion protein|nr:HlyD family type I secretion periplasmic adaptor subunit [Rhodospirillales bacterium]